MHVYLGLSLFEEACRDVLGRSFAIPKLREISGAKDRVLSLLLELLQREVTAQDAPGDLFVRGLALALAVHLVRTYADADATAIEKRGGLPAFKLRKVTDLMDQHLDDEFDLQRFARTADLSPFHFSRLFKKATGFSPSQYFIRMRMAKACLLLRETDRSVIDVGLDVGYSSPSHFAQVFRREIGVVPTRYRR